MMRTLLLLNTTQRKLQQEESIYDSSAPLKALQLARMAYMLNDHLHHEQAMQTRSFYDRQMDFRPIQTTIEEEEVDEETMHGSTDEDDALLAEMYTAIEVGQTMPDNEFNSVIEVEDIEDSGDSADPSTFSSQHGLTYDEDVLEIDITDLDLDDMPTLSRHSSHTSVPSLYHSDGDSDEEDHQESLVQREDALSRFLSSDHHSVSHPATPLYEKSTTIDASSLTENLAYSLSI